jgi:hypothetical protein
LKTPAVWSAGSTGAPAKKNDPALCRVIAVFGHILALRFRAGIELSDGIEILAQNRNIYEIISLGLFALSVYKAGNHQFFKMLRNSRLRVIEFRNKILVADHAALQVLCVNEPEDLHPCGMGKSIRTAGDQLDILAG